MLAVALKNCLYREFVLPTEAISEKFRLSFSALSKDRYMRSGDNYRFRAFSKGTLIGNEIYWDDNSDFFQDQNINKYMGGVERVFNPLCVAAQQAAQQLIIASNFFPAGSRQQHQLGCHQIRITVTEDNIGMPAPEGFHRDGFEYIIISCVDSDNIYGGLTLLKLFNDESNTPLYTSELGPGSALLLDDVAVEHYTTPITHKIPGNGYRDVLVLTFKKIT
ncbi:2OG-Fe dioxygenase family protein [Pseudomonas brassicacearum]|uniref:2OG-Fe dioxygenase family protein n=1 Tax=Pseudomonas brassicacearum TaxID=930166 RepID=UPI003D6BA684